MHSVYASAVLSRPRLLCIALALVLASLIGLTPDQAFAAPPASPAPAPSAEIAIDTFTGGNYAEFWWDSSQIPGCANVHITLDNIFFAFVPCTTQPWRADGLQAGVTYSYRFYFQDSEGKTIGYALGVGRTVAGGVYAGVLHTDATIGGSATVSPAGVSVTQNGTLTVQSGAVVNGGTIKDFTGDSEDCSSRAGRVVASNATFNDTQISFCSGSSILQQNEGNAAVTLLAPAKVSGNTLGSVSVAIATGGQAILQDNILPTGDIIVSSPSNVHIDGCEFQAGGV